MQKSRLLVMTRSSCGCSLDEVGNRLSFLQLCAMCHRSICLRHVRVIVANGAASNLLRSGI
jgi:hypothetical protein